MQNSKDFFSSVTQRLGYGEVAQLADVSYQAVSNFAADPRPGHKYRVRRRILTAVIDKAETRVKQLRQEAEELESQLDGLKTWRADQFGN